MLSLSTPLDQIRTHQPVIGDLEQDGSGLELESWAAALDATASASPAHEYGAHAATAGGAFWTQQHPRPGHGGARPQELVEERHSGGGACMRVWKRAVR
jgi:hypothetical protein